MHPSRPCPQALFATARRWEWEDLTAPGSAWSPFGDGASVYDWGWGGATYDGAGMGGLENTAGIAPAIAGWYVRADDYVRGLGWPGGLRDVVGVGRGGLGLWRRRRPAAR